MSRTSKLLLGTTIGQVNLNGEKVQGSAYYGNSIAKHTIAVYTSTFDGRLSIQASLATDPQESDWFTIHLDPNSSDFFVEYTASTNVTTFNFTGNYIWLRASIDRSYLSVPSDPGHGYISKILLNY